MTQGGRLVAVQNRLNVIDPLQIMKGKTFLVEGVVFYNLKRRDANQTWRAKLRRDMFDRFYCSVPVVRLRIGVSKGARLPLRCAADH